MILPIVQYGHPVLRQKGAPVTEITPAIRQLIADMLDTMHEAHGVGLAAQQVGQALQLTVLDVRGITDRPSSLELGGAAAVPDEHMPMVLINPQLAPGSEPSTGPEGCLSFPEIVADITRPESVAVQALNAEGQSVRFHCGGLLARAIQHEHDHLQGILFIDRMTAATRNALRPEIDALQAATKKALQTARRQPGFLAR
jgi:peptide deformylase